ncbi:hypothetical protein OQA88_5362 [Cercophora sp. LCS_1]
MSNPNKPSPAGSQSSSRGFIARFWRQKLNNDHALPDRPPPPQPNWMPGGGQFGPRQPYDPHYAGQPLEPPRVADYSMMPSMSPAATPQANYAGSPTPLDNYNPAQQYTQYPSPFPNPQAPVNQTQMSHGQIQHLPPLTNPYIGTYPPQVLALFGGTETATPPPDPSSSAPSMVVSDPSPSEPPAVVIEAVSRDTEQEAEQEVAAEEPKADSVKGSSPDLSPPNPPEELPAFPSGPGGIATLAPPVLTKPLEASPGLSPIHGFFPGLNPDLGPGDSAKTEGPTEAETTSPTYYDTNKPTCSLNLVCYRSGAKGCELQQIQGILRSKYSSDGSFEAARTANPTLITTDDQFFHEMERLYETKMCSFLRRHFSLKSLKAFRVLAYTPVTRPTVVPFDDFILQEMMYAYRNPDRVSSASNDWVQWMFRLRRKEKRHALEFVEGWNTTRIAISGTVPWLNGIYGCESHTHFVIQ